MAEAEAVLPVEGAAQQVPVPLVQGEARAAQERPRDQAALQSAAVRRQVRLEVVLLLALSEAGRRVLLPPVPRTAVQSLIPRRTVVLLTAPASQIRAR